MQMTWRSTAIAVATTLIFSGGAARSDVKVSDLIEVLGSVSNAARPVENALVVALNLTDFYMTQTFTDRDGGFRLPPLKAGVYRIIAYKSGFSPAVMTLAPNRRDHRLALRLKNEALTKSEQQEIWEVRRSLPKDILRELDHALGVDEPLADSTRFHGQMVSVAGRPENQSDTRLAQTSVGVSGVGKSGWSVDFKGKMQLIDERETETRNGDPIAESAGVEMEVKASESDSYRIVSSRNLWRYSEQAAAVADREVGLQSHNLQWRHDDSGIEFRYLTHENLFLGDAFDSEQFELAGDTKIYTSPRADLAVSLRLGQQTVVGSSSVAPADIRTADVLTNGRYDVGQSFAVHYGMQGRLTSNGSEFVPQSAAEVKIGERVSVIFSGAYKVLGDDNTPETLPTIMLANDIGTILPRYRYSVGLASRSADGDFIVMASTSEVDSRVRVVFDDRFQQLWDGFYLEPGDVRSDVTLEFSRKLGKVFTVEVVTAGGSAKGLGERAKHYLNGDFQSMFHPTGTSVDVSYRFVGQPVTDRGLANFESERMNVRMGQSLHLPLDLRLLLGLEIARAVNSPFLIDVQGTGQMTRRYIGGLSVAF